MDTVQFEDADVNVKLYDNVSNDWVHADYDETNPEHISYIQGRENIQPKLVAGRNVVIDSDTNEISAEITLDQFPDLISQDSGNDIKIGNDGKLYAGVFIKDCGSVNMRANLPLDAQQFDAYYINDENLYVFARRVNGSLSWMPLSFYVDMNLYVTQTAFSNAMTDVYGNFANYYTKSEADEKFVSKTALGNSTTEAIVNLLYPIGGNQRFAQFPNAPTPANQFGMGEWEVDSTLSTGNITYWGRIG